MKFNFDNVTVSDYKNTKPFEHVVIDDFLDFPMAEKLEKAFFNYDSPKWHRYSNAVEEKKTCNIWNEFDATLYYYFTEVNSARFLNLLSGLVGTNLFPDFGLHGGGLHIHSGGGNLNPHLDYSIHPKIKLQRKINLIYYCSSDIELAESGFGSLGLWDGTDSEPGKLIKKIPPKFNRAVIFDTTQNSWHGLVDPLPMGSKMLRKSLATYYLSEPDKRAVNRSRAMFAPRDDQIQDAEVLETIAKRSDESTFSSVYVTPQK